MPSKKEREERLNEKQIKIVIGALLHDIGKVLYRYNDSRNHSQSGYDFLQEQGVDDSRVLEQIMYHHSKFISNADIPKDSPAYITYWADNVSAGADRRSASADLSQGTFEKYVPLQSVFNILNGNDEHQTYQMHIVNDDGKINYPGEHSKSYSDAEYGQIIDNLKSGLKQIEFSQPYVNSLLSVMEANLSYVPSSSDTSQIVDISLFDHVKTTAAIGSCIHEYLKSESVDDYRSALYRNGKDYYDKKSFLMFSMDISGIQNFIYSVDSSEALKSLRAKSFYLEIMLEHIVDELLEMAELSRANLIYSGGGHAYILLPNTRDMIEKIEIFDSKTRDWFIDNYNIELYVAMGYAECSANELMNKVDGSYADIIKRVSSALSSKKSSRYTAEDIRKLNTQHREQHARECRVCGRVDSLTDEDICKFCNSFKKVSGDILNESFISILSGEDTDKNCVKLPYDRYMVLESESELRNRISNDPKHIRSYSKNKMYTGMNLSTKLWVGDYSSASSFSELASASTGIKRLGVLRADVDNLGEAFVNGFSQEYVSLSRTSTFSRKLSMFFKLHINDILSNGNYFISGKPGSRNAARNATIVYSGGDDVFIVGAWDDILNIGIDLQEAFRSYTQGTLTLSAGVGIFPQKYPVKALARQTGSLEEASKDMPGKNAVTLFDPQDRSNTYCWDELKNNVIGEKYRTIDDYFSNVPEKGMAALYKLLEYIRNSDDKINLARLAYMLGRMEPEGRVSDEIRDRHRDFSKTLYQWISNDADGVNRKQLITAIYLYVYLHRKRGDQDGSN